MISLLARPTYSLSEAARLLRISPAKLRWWLEGGTRGSKRYLPVLRGEPTGDSQVSWGEFIEAAYLREYRRHLPLQRLRDLREALSREFETPFPFAVSKPLIAGHDLVAEMQGPARDTGGYVDGRRVRAAHAQRGGSDLLQASGVR